MRLLTLVTLLFFNTFLSAQNTANWEIKTQKEGIIVYSRDLPNSNLKELKMTSTATSTLSAFIAILEVIQTNPDWLDGSFEVTRLEEKPNGEKINRTIIDFPFPVSDRDLISSAKITQDADTKVVTILSEAVKGVQKTSDDYVRMPLFLSQWVLTPDGNGQINIEYFLRSDPGGNIPNWVTNMLSSVGPFKTFKAIKENLKNYQQEKRAGIVE